MTFVDIASRNIHIHKVHGTAAAGAAVALAGNNKNIESSLLKITTPHIGGPTNTGPAGTRNKMLKSADFQLSNNQNIQLETSTNSIVSGKSKNDGPTGVGMVKNNSPSGIGGANLAGAGANTTDAVYKCPKCPKTYNIAKSLRKHCRKNHNKLSICFCHHCPKVSELSSMVIRVVKFTGEGY